MRFLANENFPLPSVRLLRREGYELAWVTEDSPGIEDSQVLTRAADEQRVIITFDRDYGELIYRLRLPSPTGVMYLRFRPHTPEEPAVLLLNLLPKITREHESSHLSSGR
jgi:predicted nuclease of predicted toxin-antitoxin system